VNPFSLLGTLELLFKPSFVGLPALSSLFAKIVYDPGNLSDSPFAIKFTVNCSSSAAVFKGVGDSHFSYSIPSKIKDLTTFGASSPLKV